MALLVQPGDESKTVVVDRAVDYATALGCSNVERWPHIYQLDTVVGPGESRYRFDIWVDEEGLLRKAETNLCATLAAHPLNEAYGRVIRGAALLVPLGKTAAYTLEDWANICQGVWYDEELTNRNICQGVWRDEELTNRNAEGKNATGRG
jgi:hypothetical protein